MPRRAPPTCAPPRTPPRPRLHRRATRPPRAGPRSKRPAPRRGRPSCARARPPPRSPPRPTSSPPGVARSPPRRWRATRRTRSGAPRTPSRGAGPTGASRTRRRPVDAGRSSAAKPSWRATARRGAPTSTLSSRRPWRTTCAPCGRCGTRRRRSSGCGCRSARARASSADATATASPPPPSSPAAVRRSGRWAFAVQPVRPFERKHDVPSEVATRGATHRSC